MFAAAVIDRWCRDVRRCRHPDNKKPDDFRSPGSLGGAVKRERPQPHLGEAEAALLDAPRCARAHPTVPKDSVVIQFRL